MLNICEVLLAFLKLSEEVYPAEGFPIYKIATKGNIAKVLFITPNSSFNFIIKWSLFQSARLQLFTNIYKVYVGSREISVDMYDAKI